MQTIQKKTTFSSERFDLIPIVGIVRGIAPDDFRQILPIYVKAGLTTVEVTMNTPQVGELIRYAVDAYSEKLNVGAGTVCSLSDLEMALRYGAQFIVTPVVNPEVIRTCVERKIPVFPGALTPSEIHMAYSLGASVVKVFPAAHMGANYLKEITGPLDKVKLLPTGGISLENMEDFLKIGVHGFGIGSPLFDKALIASKNWPGLEEHFSNYVQLIRNFKERGGK